MPFNTEQFALFFAVVYPLYLCLRHRPQTWMLLLASWYFYASWNWRFLFLLILSTTIDYHVGRAMETREGRARQRLVTLSVVVNLTILGIFKYFNFFVESAALGIHALGFQPHLPVLRVVLPVGISFYTFQAMAYTIDVYRGKARACRDFATFALYVSYFPHLVAGPIQRTDDLLPQLERPRTVTWDQIGSGLYLVLLGLVRKVVIADSLSPLVDHCFSHPETLPSAELVRGIGLFALQIYGDFAGYTDMARGISRMMGIELIENFRQPYFSRNVTEFWRRWHISLGRWLRDYLYVPLGGNRGPSWFVRRNLLLTMLLGGLWHGASWTFVIWGLLHGVALVVHRWWSRERGSPSEPVVPWLSALASWLLTMLVVGVGWLLFRCQDFATLKAICGRLVHWSGPLRSHNLRFDVPMVLLWLAIELPQYRTQCQEAALRWHWLLRGFWIAGLILSIAIFRQTVDVPFIYFQF